ncbi:4-hydroxybenzoate polyprenyltransferase [Amycolatopsis xylanica]|uniref:4-hydroxybenzoate polyprenyltransferase n=2 Tax=Amycolatopsis xylanica TaxID=589385 RepID=A0A1H2UE31_9PSEU|nr:UbiA family prenyltransferase [Amycolatopsis xylanica]SDW54395.1 4-hydroxybenzoate polyprenyltransferase [Amycolatopsis xylanica]
MGRAVRNLLQIGSIRFTAYYWVTFLLGLGVVGKLSVRAAVLAFPFWALYCLCTELVNRIADRREDEVNRPERTALCLALGWRRVGVLAIVLWSALILADIAWLISEPGTPLLFMLVYAAVISLSYSWGLRLKQRPILGQLTLTMPLVMPYLTGIALAGDWRLMAAPGLPGAAILMVLALGLVGIKDITDVEGDRLIGYRSLWVRLAEANRRWMGWSATAPLLPLTVLAAVGWMPLRTLTLWLLVPLSWATIAVAARAVGTSVTYAAREVMHCHLALCLAAALAITVFTPLALVCAALGLLFWLAASRFAHWGPSLSRNDVAEWLRLLGDLRKSKTQEA